ncbi:MAG: hypothetical protein OCD02_19270 [Spirochaetaceae bacterium]
MKRISITSVILLLILCEINAEVVGVPKYDYSINPLIGSVLQDFEEESTLSWLSEDYGVALSIKAWEGSTFSDVTAMFNELTEGFNAAGDCVKFDYLDMQGVIGEVTFPVSGVNNKGWIIFLNGSKFDYYLISFTLEDNYREYYSEIQSVLDSFSSSSEGALRPGPVSAFYDQSPTNVNQDYTVDFFDNKLEIKSSKYSFTTSQTAIEREANVMLNYSNNPELFYKAWSRYYKLIFRDNYSRLEPVYQGLYPYFANDKYTDYELTELLMFWIQGYTYARSLESASDLLNPIEAALTKTGDCDSRSLILGILLHKFGINSILLTSEKVKHALLAVNCPGEGATYEYNGKKYLTVELTAKMLIGEISEKHSDLSLWTPVEMEYTNGY